MDGCRVSRRLRTRIKVGIIVAVLPVLAVASGVSGIDIGLSRWMAGYP